MRLEVRGPRLKNRVVDGQADEEYDKVAVPESGQDVVQPALVRFRFVLVLFANTNNVLSQEEQADAESDKSSDNQ